MRFRFFLALLAKCGCRPRRPAPLRAGQLAWTTPFVVAVVLVLLTTTRFPAKGIGSGGLLGAERANPLIQSLKLEAVASLGGGVRFLTDRQAGNGSWANDPTITALATTALSSSSRQVDFTTHPDLDKALDFIKAKMRDDGGLIPPEATESIVVATSLGLQALAARLRPGDRDAAGRALAFLLRSQNADGGFPLRPDTASSLVGTLHAVEAIHVAALSGVASLGDSGGTTAPLARANRFIASCQRLGDIDEEPETGYFLLAPADQTPSPEICDTPTTRALLTCMGLRGLVYGNPPASSDAVRDAMRWLENHAAFDHHPGTEQLGYYEYLLNLVKTLRVGDLAGLDFSQTPALANWRHAAASEILKRQTGFGRWRTEEPEGREERPESTTAQAILIILNIVQ